MTNLNKYLACFALALLSSCGLFDSGEVWRDKPYFVGWIDIPSELTLSYDLGKGTSVGRVGAKVVAVGSNDKYVVAKQSLTANHSVLHYYVIDRAKDGKYADIPKDVVLGPFSEDEFEKKSKELNLPKLSKTFK